MLNLSASQMKSNALTDDECLNGVEVLTSALSKGCFSMQSNQLFLSILQASQKQHIIDKYIMYAIIIILMLISD